MKFKLYLKSGLTEIIDAKDIDGAFKIAKKKKDVVDVKCINSYKHRKSPTLNKRAYVKKSDKVYDRKKAKKDLKKDLEDL